MSLTSTVYFGMTEEDKEAFIKETEALYGAEYFTEDEMNFINNQWIHELYADNDAVAYGEM